MTDEEINEAFGAQAMEGPFWRAIITLLQEQVATCTHDTSTPGLSDPVRQYEAGRLSNALEILDSLQDRMRTVKARSPALS